MNLREDDAVSAVALVMETTADTAASVQEDLGEITEPQITEPEITNAAEIAVIESLTGVALDDTVSDVGAVEAEAAARRYAGLLFNTPQYLLDGVASPDQAPANDPVLAVPGTGTAQLCAYLGDLVLGDAFEWSCSADGITISG